MKEVSSVALTGVPCSSNIMEYTRCFPVCFNDKKFRPQVTLSLSFCGSVYNVFMKHMMAPESNHKGMSFCTACGALSRRKFK